MRHRIQWLVVGLLVAQTAALAQNATLRGTIRDGESGDPLPTANLFIVDLQLGAVTDLEGRYTLENLPVRPLRVRVSFVGYRTTERVVNLLAGANTADFSLQPDYLGLDEVVVTGIASATSKARAEVAVSRVDASQLQEVNAYQDISQLLNGKVTGVSVQPASGNVAGGIRFLMRASTGLNGNGQPVIYVDGVRVDNAEITANAVGGQGFSMLASLNPEDIQTIDVLKGPAGAALYGTSGSNGVVLITTKKGRLAGGGLVPFDLNYKGSLGYNGQANEYTKFNAGTPETANAFFRDGTISQHMLSASGGSAIVRYFASYDKRYEEGHLRNNKQDRQSFRANFEAYPTKTVTVKANAGYTVNEVNRPQNDNNILGYLGNTLLSRSPFIFTDSTGIENIVDQSRVSRFLGGIDAEWQPIRDLTVRAAVGMDGTDLRSDQTFPSNLPYTTVTNGSREIYNRRNEQYTYDVNARYTYTIRPTIVGATVAGFQAFNLIRRTFFITKENFSTELITNVGAGADFIAGDEGFLHAREAGLFAQQELQFNSKFFLTLGARRDFASTVGEGAPAIWYPKASFAVLVDQIVNLPTAIDFLKLRTAYGETGQLPGTLDKSPLRWQAEPSGWGTGAVTSFIGNEEIEPERIREVEVGLEASFLNRFGIDLTGYYQIANNSIIDFENPPSTGLTASDVPFNVGESRGWGLEASLEANVFRTLQHALDLTFLWSYQENEVQDLGGAQPIFDGFDVNVIKEGLARDAFYTWSSVAKFNDDGTYAGAQLTSTDLDGDGTADRVFIGLPYPKHNGSFTANLRLFKNLSVSALADWMLGLTVYNNTARFQAQFGGLYERNRARVQIGQITAASVGLEDEGLEVFQPGTPEYKAAAETVAGTEWRLSGLALNGNYMEDADYLKLREIAVRYDFSDLLPDFGGRRRIRSLALSLNARNLWMTTTYSGADPEVNFDGSRSSSRATDFLTLPQPRTIYSTITVGF